MNKELLQQVLEALPLATLPFKPEPMLYRSDVIAAIAQSVQPALEPESAHGITQKETS